MGKQLSFDGRYSGSRVSQPVRLFVGQRNIRVNATGSAAALGRQMQEAFKVLTDDLNYYLKQLEGWLPEDMIAALEPTFEKSQELCPKDTNELVDSSYLEARSFRGGVRVEMGYGKNGKAPYGVYVHEMLEYAHEEPTQAKFLEQPVDEDYFDIIQRVTDRVRVRLGG